MLRHNGLHHEIIQRAHTRVLTIVLTALLFSAVACAPTQTKAPKREIINELVIRNQTDAPITDVKLRVSASQTLVSTNRILPRSEYAIGFRANENRREAANLSWVHRNLPYQSEITTVVPPDLVPATLARVVVRIGENGTMTSVIEPHPD